MRVAEAIRMSTLRPRLTVVIISGLVALGVALVWRSRDGARRYRSAQDRASVACRAYRSAPKHADANVCRGFDEFGPRAADVYRRVQATLARAEASFAAGDRRAAETAIEEALSSLDELARIGTPIASIFGATIVERLLDLLRAHPEVDRAALLRNAQLDGAERPLESARLQHLWDLAHWNASLSEIPMPTEATLADEMEADEAAFERMEDAVLASDVQGCQRAARTGGARMRANSVLPLYCEKLVRVVQAGKRLDEARAEARESATLSRARCRHAAPAPRSP